MTSEQAFEILGIKDRKIDEASLKKAFYAAARKVHPDSNPNDGNAKERFHLINEAYEVLGEYLKYEKRRTEEARQAHSKENRKTAEGAGRADAPQRDVWEAYAKADQKYARKRHSDASEKAEETIRNHVKHERERAEREARERAAREQAKKSCGRGIGRARESAAQSAKALRGAARAIWRYIRADKARTKKGVLAIVAATAIFWAGTQFFASVHNITSLTLVIAEIAKWVLMVWMSYRITLIVHKNWKNRILSAFALLVSMEAELILMNQLEAVVRGIHL